MKKIILIYFSLLLTLAAGCASSPTSYPIRRVPAQDDDPLLKEAFEEALTFPLINAGSPGYDYSEEFIERGEFILRNDLGENIAFKIELDKLLPEDKFSYRIYHSPLALGDKAALGELQQFIYTFENYFSIPHYDTHKLFSLELYYNAKWGDPLALQTLLQIKEESSASYAKVREMKKKLEVKVKELKAKRADEKKIRKKALDILDKLPEEKQFRSLVAKGDRQGAAELIKAYLPWEEMAPVEKKFWETYLQTVTHPVPLEQRVLIYRGLTRDPIQAAIVNGKKLSLEEAVKQGQAFFMAPLLIKNQGSWNRRLRSLESMNKKYIGSHRTTDVVDGNAHNARINTLFRNHSRDPKGSPFLSFTPNYDTASRFGLTQMASYLVDPRLLNDNYSSIFPSETEFLMAITTFPDELVGVSLENGEQRESYLRGRLEKVITEKYGEENKDIILNKIQKNTYHFFQNKFNEKKYFFKLPPVDGPNQGSDNLKFYEKFLGKGDIKPNLSPDGNLSCTDIMSFLLNN